MNKKELIEKIKLEMPEFKGNELEKEIKKALYIYITLGKEKAFDEKYFFGNNKTKKRIYNLAQKENFNEPSRGKKIICVSISRLYKMILEEFNIKSETIKDDPDDDHMYLNIKLSNGRILKTDVQRELYRIQTKSTLKFFGKNFISNEDLLKYEKEVGYIEEEQEFMDEKIEKIKKETTNMSISEKLRYLLYDKCIYESNKNMEYVEIHNFYKSLFSDIMKGETGKKIFSFPCYKETQEGERDYTICVYSKEKEEYRPYLYSKKENRFLEISMQKMCNFIDDGLILGTNKNGNSKENGVKMLERRVDEERKKDKTNFCKNIDF